MSQLNLNISGSQLSRSFEQSTKTIEMLKWTLNQRVDTIKKLTRENKILTDKQERLRNHMINIENMEMAKLKNLEELFVEKLHEVKNDYNKKLSFKDRQIKQLMQQLNKLKRDNIGQDDTEIESPRKRVKA
jgi:predicted RNase H-like nuclease (RuvC/YqgF family)